MHRTVARRAGVGGAIVVIALLWSCVPQARSRSTHMDAKLAAQTQPATAPTPTLYTDPSHLVQFLYPGNWRTQNDPDDTIELAHDALVFTLNVPDLPPHIPGFIPLNMVISGYVDDLKKEHTDLKLLSNQPLPVPNASARRIRLGFQQDRAPYIESTVLMTHGDHVLIFRVLAPQEDLAAAEQTADSILTSIHWLK